MILTRRIPLAILSAPSLVFGLLALAALGLCVAAWSWEGGLLVWALSPAYSAPRWLGAWLRGGHPYRDAEHERSAYGQVASGWDQPWQE